MKPNSLHYWLQSVSGITWPLFITCLTILINRISMTTVSYYNSRNIPSNIIHLLLEIYRKFSLHSRVQDERIFPFRVFSKRNWTIVTLTIWKRKRRVQKTDIWSWLPTDSSETPLTLWVSRNPGDTDYLRNLNDRMFQLIYPIQVIMID